MRERESSTRYISAPDSSIARPMRAAESSISSCVMMMSAITKKQDLSKEEIDELYAILRKADADLASKDSEVKKHD